MQRNQLMMLERLDQLVRICLSSVPRTHAHEYPSHYIPAPQHHSPPQIHKHIASETSNFVPVSQPTSTPLRESVEPLPIEGLNIHTALPSSAIRKDDLRTADKVLSNYDSNKKSVKTAGRLACQLSREAIFGVEVLKLCTPLGAGKYKGLPTAELNFLKKLMLPNSGITYTDLKKHGKSAKQRTSIVAATCVVHVLAMHHQHRQISNLLMPPAHHLMPPVHHYPYYMYFIPVSCMYVHVHSPLHLYSVIQLFL